MRRRQLITASTRTTRPTTSRTSWPGATSATARSSGWTRPWSPQDPGLTEIVFQPLFANLRDDPRWLPFLRRIGKAPEQLAAIKFDVRVPQ